MPRLTPPRDASKVTFVTIGTTRRPADEAGVDSAAARARRPLLGRLGVGAKLMLLVLLPVGVLLGFTIAESADNWRTALSLRDFQNATEQSFAATDVAAALAEERTAAALMVLRPGDASLQRLRAAQAGVDAALKEGTGRAGAWVGTVDLGGRLDAARRQLNAVRVELASNTLTVAESADAYGSIIRDLLRTVGQLDAAAPTRPSARASQAYVAIVEAIEAAAREQVDVAALFASEPADALAASSATRWSGLEAAQLDVFRDNATGPLAADLEAVQFSPSGITVTAVRDALANRAPGALREPSLTGWLDASGTRIASLRDLQGAARKNLAATASNDLAAARTGSLRDVGISLAVLLIVTGLALALRRSITSPLREVSEAAQHLSSGDLTVHVDYRGRDEIGDVATAFRNLHVTVERLAKEIREMTAAVRHNRLGHRADVAAFEGTWSQLLAGLNDTMAAFAELEGRRERAERELSDFFQLSLDLLCIGNLDGYFTRVNPAFEQTLGYTSAELTSRPFVEFVHPDDRELTAEAFASQKRGNELIGLENRYICSDGSVRWLQWTARALPEEGFACAVARDITERRRNEEEQAALRRVATLVAQGARRPRRSPRLPRRWDSSSAAISRPCSAIRRTGRRPSSVAGASPASQSRSAHVSTSQARVSACGCLTRNVPLAWSDSRARQARWRRSSRLRHPTRSRRADHGGGPALGRPCHRVDRSRIGCPPEVSFAQRNSPTCSRQRLLTRRLARRCGELPTNRRPCDGWRRRSPLRPRRTPYSLVSRKKSAASFLSTAHTWRDTTPTAQ